MGGASICRRAMRRPLPVPMAVPVVLALALALASCAACTGGPRPADPLADPPRDYPDAAEIDAFFDALLKPEGGGPEAERPQMTMPPPLMSGDGIYLFHLRHWPDDRPLPDSGFPAGWAAN